MSAYVTVPPPTFWLSQSDSAALTRLYAARNAAYESCTLPQPVARVQLEGPNSARITTFLPFFEIDELKKPFSLPDSQLACEFLAFDKRCLFLSAASPADDQSFTRTCAFMCIAITDSTFRVSRKLVRASRRFELLLMLMRLWCFGGLMARGCRGTFHGSKSGITCNS